MLGDPLDLPDNFNVNELSKRLIENDHKDAFNEVFTGSKNSWSLF